MPDLLAHACIAYALCRLLSWRWDWLSDQYVTLGMVGAFIPDLVKIKLLVPASQVEHAIGVPFRWKSLHTGGGVALSVLVGVVLLSRGHRRRGGLVLALGTVSHLAADSLLRTATGHPIQWFWPLSQYKPPSPGLYLSTQLGPTVVAGAVALLVWVADRSRSSDDPAGQ